MLLRVYTNKVNFPKTGKLLPLKASIKYLDFYITTMAPKMICSTSSRAVITFRVYVGICGSMKICEKLFFQTQNLNHGCRVVELVKPELFKVKKIPIFFYKFNCCEIWYDNLKKSRVDNAPLTFSLFPHC